MGENSSEMYLNHHPVEIEGNETLEFEESIGFENANDIAMKEAVNTSMGNVGELSITAQHSVSAIHFKVGDKKHSFSGSHKHFDNNFIMKIDIAAVRELDVNEDNDDNSHSNLSEEETSESSKTFTIKSDDNEHDDVKLNMHQNDDINTEATMMENGYLGLTSPTETTMRGSPTPQMTMSPIMDPDQILHSLNFRNKLKAQQDIEKGNGTPPGSGIYKLPKPKTKGQWM